jgi:hypothetical protein
VQLAVWLLFSAGLLTACGKKNDLGTPCALLKSNPDGGQAKSVTEADLPSVRADYISLGSPVCNEACVRDADATRTGNPTAVALAYCSVNCGSNNDCGSGYSCRSLLLDQDTLNAICDRDAATCRALGGADRPLYCARGTTGP